MRPGDTDGAANTLRKEKGARPPGEDDRRPLAAVLPLRTKSSGGSSPTFHLTCFTQRIHLKFTARVKPRPSLYPSVTKSALKPYAVQYNLICFSLSLSGSLFFFFLQKVEKRKETSKHDG